MMEWGSIVLDLPQTYDVLLPVRQSDLPAKCVQFVGNVSGPDLKCVSVILVVRVARKTTERIIRRLRHGKVQDLIFRII